MQHDRSKLALHRRRSSDDAFIASLSHAAFSEYAANAGSRATRPGLVTVVATRDERPVGFFTLRAAGEVSHLDAIAVVEPERGRGVGRTLLAAAEREAGRAGARAVELATAESNLAALELFLKSGYRIVRTVVRFYPRGQTAHLLRKQL